MKKRITSAVLLIIILLPIVIIGKIPFIIAVGLIGLLANYEINKLNKYPLIIKLLSLISMLLLIYSNYNSNTIINGLNYKIITLILLILFIPIIFYQVKGIYTVDDAFKLSSFTILIGLGLNYFILIRDYSLKYFMFVVLIPILTDTFAYFGGILLGKHKATKLSPKKSWEGYIIGSLVSTILMTIYYNSFIGFQQNQLLLVFIIILMTIISHIGDLFFSAIKRNYNIKDFSNLIPGHGGIIDRLDSLIFVSFLFIIFIEYL